MSTYFQSSSKFILFFFCCLLKGFVQFTADAKSVYYINKRIRKEKLQLKDLKWKELYLKKQVGAVEIVFINVFFCL